jgi:hypothetical protein
VLPLSWRPCFPFYSLKERAGYSRYSRVEKEKKKKEKKEDKEEKKQELPRSSSSFPSLVRALLTLLFVVTGTGAMCCPVY